MVVLASFVHVTRNHVRERLGDIVQYRHAPQFFLYRAIIVYCMTELHALCCMIYSFGDAVTHGAGKGRGHTKSAVI